MHLSSPFIKRPIATTLLALGVAIAGILSFNFLPVSSLPQMDFPTISVQASLPGASPENMATSIATPLERQLGRIAGVTEMTSTSTLGSTRITIQFDLSRDIDGAARDVQAAINAAQSFLPTNLPSNPTYRKVNPADAPILILVLTSDLHNKGQLYDAASTILQQKLAQIAGIGQVMVGGSSLPAIRVEVNPTTLDQYNISLTQVSDAIAATNVHQPIGQLGANNLVTNDQLFKADQYKPLIVTYRKSAVRLSNLAEVKDSVEDIRTAGLANGKPAVLIILFKQPGANVIETVKRVRALLPHLQAAIPSGIDMTVALDRTDTIRASLFDVELTLVISMILVILVTFAFLRNRRAMIVAGVAVPLSLLGAFSIMKLIGFSLDNLSLMALTISTGFVVDDAVVVLENISRHLERGKTALKAAYDGAREVGFTVLSMSLSLIAVFVPILLMGGIVGRLFREFAVTLSVAILVSLIVSLTVTPMMCAHWLTKIKNGEQQPNRFTLWYKNALTWSLAHPHFMLLITLLAIVLNVVLFIAIPKGFFPQQDTGRISASIQADQNISFQAMEKKLKYYVNTIYHDPAVANVVGFIGGGSATTNASSIFIMLKPMSERHLSVDRVIARLREQLKNIPGAALYMQPAQDLVIGGRQGNAQFQYTISAYDLKELNTWTPRVMAALKKLPDIVDVNSDQQDHGLQSYVTIDRETAARFGITTQQIDNTLYRAFGQSQISTIFTEMNQYRVVMEVAEQYRNNPEALNHIYIPSAGNVVVPLAVMTHANPAATLLAVNHQSQLPSATLSFNLVPDAALGDAVASVDQAIKDMHLPDTMHGAFRGTAQAFRSSLASEPYLIAAALLAVYIVLGILYESLMHPLTIISTLPSAGVGALLALMLTGTELSIIALIGVILLIGIVKKNAIMMIDVALDLQRGNHISAKDAIFTAAQLRFRPIMMTTMAAMFGAFPLAFGFGVGAELRSPLGIAIIGGLIVSQMLTLFTTPVVYLTFENIKQSMYHKWMLLWAR